MAESDMSRCLAPGDGCWDSAIRPGALTFVESSA
jgi:hypothetical protein